MAQLRHLFTLFFSLLLVACGGGGEVKLVVPPNLLTSANQLLGQVASTHTLVFALGQQTTEGTATVQTTASLVTQDGKALNMILPNGTAVGPTPFSQIKFMVWEDLCHGWHSQGKGMKVPFNPSNLTVIPGLNPSSRRGNLSVILENGDQLYVSNPLTKLIGNGVEVAFKDDPQAAGDKNMIAYGPAGSDLNAPYTCPTGTNPPPVFDGAALYTQYCSACHGALASSTKKNKTAAQITAAIASVSNMVTTALQSLTSAQIEAIASALVSTPTPPPTSSGTKHVVEITSTGTLTITPQVSGSLVVNLSQNGVATLPLASVKDVRVSRRSGIWTVTPTNGGLLATLVNGVATFTGLPACDMFMITIMDVNNVSYFLNKDFVEFKSKGTTVVPTKVGNDGLLYYGTAATSTNGACS